MARNLAAVVMAGGLGTRMHSSVPKHLHPLLGRRMVDWVLHSARTLEPRRVVVVVSPETADSYEGVDAEIAVQQIPRGTGDAVASARPALAGFDGDVIVLSGDTPLLTADVLGELLGTHERERADATVLSFTSDRPLPYGRIVRAADGSLTAIVEERDATPEQREIRELNTSIYVFRVGPLWKALGEIDPDNVQGELYLTDAVGKIVEGGGRAAVDVSSDPVAPSGVNNRADLAFAAGVLRERVCREHMVAGATIVDPGSTWIEAEVELENDVVVHPFTVLRGRTTVAEGAEIGPHSVADDASIGPAARVGPFCYLRPGTVLEAGAKAGAFVEIKNSRIGERSKVPHLSYIGDADIGEDSNIAAANVTANFAHRAGEPKKRTKIGRNVKTGVDNTFVAPVTVADDAWIAAGTVVTDDVPAGALAGFPPRQVNKEGYVHRDRNR
jgi:bifunctional UDP-N-acetylglucosamine pyrophosphorylase / glucosamine-1-phosphate N-acetyltransferase